MAASGEETPPALPDYVLDADAVLKDESVTWRHGSAPDYSATRKVYEKTKTKNHEAGSLPDLVEKLVKNWEIEASYKTNIADWRTIDHANYTFAINGGPPQSGEHMLKVGTYNAIINKPNEFYSSEHTDLTGSHHTFKSMMPSFAWEVLEVYSGPPKVAFRWRHWGTMKGDYIGFNDKGERVTAKSHGGPINIEGLTVALVNDKLQVLTLETWFDPLEMFRQIAPKGDIAKEIIQPPTSIAVTGDEIADAFTKAAAELSRVAAALKTATAQLNSVSTALTEGERRSGGAEVTPDRSDEIRTAQEELTTALMPAECPFLAKQE